MRAKLVSVLMAICMVIAFMPVMTDYVSAVSVATPTITSLSSEGNKDGRLIVGIDNSANASILINTTIQINNITTNETKEVAGNTTRYTFQGLTPGRTYQVRVRTVYYDRSSNQYYYSSWSPAVAALVEGGKDEAKPIQLNTWYRGTTSDYPEIFSFQTTGRADSKYRFFVRTTYAKISWFETMIEMVGTDTLLGYAAFYEKDSPVSSIYAPLQALNPNTTYKIRVFGRGSALTYERDVDYEFVVEEILALPAKGKVTSWKGGKKKATVKFSKLAKATRYQIGYKKKGGSYKYIYTTNTTKTIKKLSKKKYYYVKVRGQRYVDGAYYSGPWSAVKKAKVK